MFFTCMLYHPNNHICRLTRCISNQLAQMVMVGILQLILYDDFSIGSSFRSKNIHIEVSNGGFCFIYCNIKAYSICKKCNIIIL